MDATRRLVVDLQNLATRARDAAILADVPQLKAALESARTAALIARLDDAKKAGAKPRRRR